MIILHFSVRMLMAKSHSLAFSHFVMFWFDWNDTFGIVCGRIKNMQRKIFSLAKFTLTIGKAQHRSDRGHIERATPKAILTDARIWNRMPIFMGLKCTRKCLKKWKIKGQSEMISPPFQMHQHSFAVRRKSQQIPISVAFFCVCVCVFLFGFVARSFRYFCRNEMTPSRTNKK